MASEEKGDDGWIYIVAGEDSDVTLDVDLSNRSYNSKMTNLKKDIDSLKQQIDANMETAKQQVYMGNVGVVESTILRVKMLLGESKEIERELYELKDDIGSTDVALGTEDNREKSSDGCSTSSCNYEKTLLAEAIDAHKALQQWDIQGPNIKRLLGASPEEVVIMNSIRTAAAEAERREYLSHLARDLQEVDDEILSKFEDKHYMLALKKAFANGKFD